MSPARNPDGKVGAVGRIPFYLDRIFNIKVVKYDVETENPSARPGWFHDSLRERRGVGEAIGKIPDDPGATTGRFEGYRSEDETRRKILHEVFERGDSRVPLRRSDSNT